MWIKCKNGLPYTSGDARQTKNNYSVFVSFVTYLQYTLCPNLSAANIQMHLNTTQFDRNMYNFNYLFNVSGSSFSKNTA